jgi:lipid II:glycine glycyltransferase (peptidoglycan interpeptide bridge formation enzyme)
MSESNDQIRETWEAIDDAFDDALAKCTTEEQREKLRNQHNKARTAWWAAKRKVFDENDSEVQKTREKLEGANNDLKIAKKNLDDVVAYLKFAAAAVDLATSLAGVVMV